MERQPWERKDGESAAAYRAFLIYRDLGPKRTLEAVAWTQNRQRKCKGSAVGGLLGKNSSRFEWVERAAAWDDHLQAERDRVEIEVAARDAAVWAERRQRHCEDTYQVGQILIAKGKAMLAFPNQRTTRKVDGKTVIVEPADWSFATAAHMVRAGIEATTAALTAIAMDPAEMDDVLLRGIAHDHGAATPSADPEPGSSGTETEGTGG